MKILIIDHKETDREKLAGELKARGHDPVGVGDNHQAYQCLDGASFDVVFANATGPRISGVELLARIKGDAWRDTAVVMMSSNGTIPTAVQAIKLGAFDFLKKPVVGDTLQNLLRDIEQHRQSTVAAAKRPADSSDVEREVVGTSEAINRVRRMIRISARTDANVLIYGETGTGKDLVSSVIHRQSHRREHSFVKVGCTLLPPALIETELFGHKEGAFTGADQPRKGRFELAEGGTIYLDDVDDIPLEQQAKLLRAIEEKVFERVGGSKLIRANVRIIASTKLNLLDKIAEGTFRQDLYYRLDVLRILVPPLRDRREDIPALMEFLLARISRRQPCQIDADAVGLLLRHDWPGNVRELAHTLERAVLVGGGRVTAELLEAEITAVPSFGTLINGGGKTHAFRGRPAAVPSPETPPFSGHAGGFRAMIEFAERQLLLGALDAHGGNKTAAAASLGMKASTFRDKLNKYGIH
ncbi:MAG: sigma-54-dependent Fis family transcriptional regulator [Planctomycetes bacterium]|nr:sigma-54-dependent Fis family transcriptional regulator [Planctomycetota bacterium]